jgi:hypothetical protein
MWVASELGKGSTFSFTLPLYSIARLLLPVITREGRMREAFVLVRMDLTPTLKSLRASWKETCQKCLEVLRLCINVDRDLVLPPMGTSGPVETFFVVASTDMEKVSVMMDRIRDQIGALPQMKVGGTLCVTAELIPNPSDAGSKSLEQQVWVIADHVTEIIQQGLWNKNHATVKENSNAAHA